MRTRLGLLILGMLAVPFVWAQPTELPPEATHAMEMAKALVGGGDWSGALNAYADYLGKLTTRDYRDKKTFRWILEEYERQAPQGKPDYETLKAVARAKLPKSSREKADPILTWRLHLLLADIARREGKDAEYRQALERAIAAYPDVAYGEPAKQSLLQHLYNEMAFQRAREGIPAAEGYLLDAFLEDPRFDFVYLPPWRKMYEEAGTPELYEAFARRVVETYEKKAERYPAKADVLNHYRWALEQQLPEPAAETPSS